MALYGTCSGCGATAWLNADGGCQAGHPRSAVTSIVDDEEDLATKGLLGLSTKAGRWISDLKKPKTPVEVEARQARDEYDARLSAARATLVNYAAPLDREVAEARASLNAARAFGTRVLGSCGPLRLREDWLDTPSGGINLETTAVRASVDGSGNMYAVQKGGVGRAIVGKALFGDVGAVVGSTTRKSQVHDARELYIIIESETVYSAVACNPEQGAQVRQFAALVQTTAAQAPARAAQRTALVEGWIRHVDDTVLKRAASLADVRRAYVAAIDDTRRLEAAQLALADSAG